MSAPATSRPIFSGFAPDLGAFPCLNDLRSAALARVEGAALPTYRDEEYKYTSLAHLSDGPWRPQEPVEATEDAVRAALLSGFESILVVFINGQLSHEHCRGLDADGIEFMALEDAIAAGHTSGKLGTLARPSPQEFTVAAHLGQLQKPETTLLASANTAAFTTGAFLRLKRGAKVGLPIQVAYLTVGEAPLTYPRTLILAEAESEATVLEVYASLGEVEALTIPVTEVFVAPQAVLEHVRLGNESLLTQHVAVVEVAQDADSTYRSYNVVFGTRLTRNDINIFIDGSNAHTRFDGVVAIDGDQHVDNHTRLDHAKPHCESFEIYKHLLSGEARAVFNGKIFVHQDAQKTDAKQTNMTLLLSSDAQVDTKPQLEIFADDVKCTHGATVGYLRKDALFYMQSRGLPKKQAEALLVYAFAAEVLELIEHEGVREQLEEMLFQKLGTDLA